MKSLFVSFMLSALATLAFAQEGGTWALHESIQPATGRAIIFRSAQTFNPPISRADYPQRMILIWKYASESGMPIPAEREQMDSLEDTLDPALGNNAQAVLVLVSTGEGTREWIYYAKSKSGFLATLNAALRAAPRYPIEIHAAPDPEWGAYEAFLRDIRK